MKPKLISNWKQGWKFLSVQCMTLAGSIQATWLLIPDDMKQTIPQQYVAILTLVLAATGVIGRFIQQSNVSE